MSRVLRGFDGLKDFAQRTSPILLESRLDQPSREALDRLPRPSPDLLRQQPGIFDDQSIPDVHHVDQVPPDWLRDRSLAVERLEDDQVIGIDRDARNRQGKAAGSASIVTLAYYLPYHFHRVDWGIYLRATGIEHVAEELKGSSLEPADIDLVDAARSILYAHEYYHCVVETAATKVELIGGTHIYSLYQSELGSGDHEEALANAYALATAERRYESILPALRSWMRRQPRGYRDFGAWHGRTRFQHGRGEAADRLMHYLPQGTVERPLPSELGEFLLEEVPRSRIPTYLVREPHSWLGVFRPFPKFEGMRVLVHTNDHPPPHFHLEVPPGRVRGRFEWPTLAPLPDASPLTGKERGSLTRYLAEFGDEIFRKLASVYGRTLMPIERPQGKRP